MIKTPPQASTQAFPRTFGVDEVRLKGLGPAPRSFFNPPMGRAFNLMGGPAQTLALLSVVPSPRRST